MKVSGAPTFDVSIVESDEGWRVEIRDAAGGVIAERSCRDGSEARTYASTVRQHAYWLSPEKFRDHYRS